MNKDFEPYSQTDSTADETTLLPDLAENNKENPKPHRSSQGTAPPSPNYKFVGVAKRVSQTLKFSLNLENHIDGDGREIPSDRNTGEVRRSPLINSKLKLTQGWQETYALCVPM